MSRNISIIRFYSKYYIYFFLNIIFFLQPISSFLKDETLTNFFFTFFYIIVILHAQFFLVSYLSSKIKQKKIEKFLLILCLSVNFICIYFHVSNFYASLNINYKLFTIIPIIIFFYFLYTVINFNEKTKIVFKNILLTIILVQIYIGYNSFTENKINKAVKKVSYDHYPDDIKFVKRPKIFIFIMDALTPKMIVEKKLGFEPNYSKYLNSKFKNFDFVMTDFASTISTLNSLLYLNTELWIKDKNRNKLFNGLYESPLFDIFKKNNYKISTFSSVSQFNSLSKYIDFNSFKNYGNEFINFYRPNFCNWIGKAFFIRYYGVCYFYKVISNKYHLGNFSLEFMSSHSDDWLSISYFPYPSHVATKITDEISLKNYRELFLERDKLATEILKESYNQIEKNTDNFIILVLGDHGLMTSNPNKFESSVDDYETIEDTYVVAAYRKDSKNICDKFFEDSNITSPTLIINALINCLAGNNVLSLNSNRNKIFIRTGYDNNYKEIYEEKYFDKEKFINMYKKN